MQRGCLSVENTNGSLLEASQIKEENLTSGVCLDMPLSCEKLIEGVLLVFSNCRLRKERFTIIVLTQKMTYECTLWVPL